MGATAYAHQLGNCARIRLADALEKGGYGRCVCKKNGLPCTGAARLEIRDSEKGPTDPVNVILMCSNQNGQTVPMTRKNAEACTKFRPPRK